MTLRPPPAWSRFDPSTRRTFNYLGIVTIMSQVGGSLQQRSCSVEFSGSSGSHVDVGIRLALDPLQVARILVAIDVFFIVAGAVVSFVSKYLGHERLMGFSDLLDVGSEGNLPNLYSSFLLMA